MHRLPSRSGVWQGDGVRVNELLYTTSVGQLAFKDRICDDMASNRYTTPSLNNFPNIDAGAEFEKGDDSDTTRHTTSTMMLNSKKKNFNLAAVAI